MKFLEKLDYGLIESGKTLNIEVVVENLGFSK